MSLKTLDPHQCQGLVKDGAVLVDVREVGEYAYMHIPGSVNAPLSQPAAIRSAVSGAKTVVYLCKSGGRTTMNGAGLAGLVKGSAYQMGGGIDAWALQGLPVERAAGGGGFGGSRLFLIGFMISGAMLAALALRSIGV
jgi:rhodanese-related sulfurtransferase